MTQENRCNYFMIFKGPPLADIARAVCLKAALCSNGCLSWSNVHTSNTCMLQGLMHDKDVTSSRLYFHKATQSFIFQGQVMSRMCGNLSHAYQAACKSHVGSSGLQQEHLCSVLILPKIDQVLKHLQMFWTKWINIIHLFIYITIVVYIYSHVRICNKKRCIYI